MPDLPTEGNFRDAGQVLALALAMMVEAERQDSTLSLEVALQAASRIHAAYIVSNAISDAVAARIAYG